MVKHTLKAIALIILAWLWLPTGDPSDFFITAYVISALGMTMYLVISALIIVLLYRTIEGKTIKAKMNTVKVEMKSLFRK